MGGGPGGRGKEAIRSIGDFEKGITMKVDVRRHRTILYSRGYPIVCVRSKKCTEKTPKDRKTSENGRKEWTKREKRSIL